VEPIKAPRIDGDNHIHINGQERRWDDLTPAEKQEVRRSIAEAKAELARTRIDRAEIQRNIREAMEDLNVDQEDLKRDLAEAREEIAQAMREVDSNAVHIRRSGQNPERIKAQIRASMKGIENIDVDAIRRQALASIDHRQIEASIAQAEASIAKAQGEIERLEIQFEDD
jgi:multidrug resistance efflux pump